MLPAKEEAAPAEGPGTSAVFQPDDGKSLKPHQSHDGDVNLPSAPESPRAKGGEPRDNNETSSPSLATHPGAWASPTEAWACPASTVPPSKESGHGNSTANPEAAPPEPTLAAAAAAAATAAQEAAVAAKSAQAAGAAVKEAAAARVADGDADAIYSDWVAPMFHPIFVFTNPTSGGNKAAAFTKVFIYDIREGPSGSKPGFLLLRAVANKAGALGASGPNTIRILVAGGDGTVMWCVDEMKKTGVNGDVCAVGVVPYGTGNDFANAFGWKPFNAANPFDSSLHTLRSLLDNCMRANVVYHDLWSVRVTLRPGGRFTKINSTTRRKEVVELAGLPVEELSFTISNYFSMGVESRIGRGFDKHRTKSQTLNKMRYGIEGFKKTFVTHTKSINQIALALTVNPGTPEEQIIFTTDQTQAKEKQVPLLKKTATLVALNIPSFSGGNDIWAPSKKLATTLQDKQKQRQAKELIKVPQQMGDGKLEFMTFRNVPSMGMEFMVHGRGSRLHSGSGPWDISFRPLDEKTRVYFQADGEFFQLTLPASVTVAHDRRVRVLSLRAGRQQLRQDDG